MAILIIHWQMASPGNWMHLQYQSRLQARKALSKDGKVFGDSIMVGVKPCIDKVSSPIDPFVCLSGKLSGSLHQLGLKLFLSPSQSVMDSNAAVSSPLSTSSVLPSTPRSAIRPLSATYRSSSSDYQVNFKFNIHFGWASQFCNFKKSAPVFRLLQTDKRPERMTVLFRRQWSTCLAGDAAQYILGYLLPQRREGRQWTFRAIDSLSFVCMSYILTSYWLLESEDLVLGIRLPLIFG